MGASLVTVRNERDQRCLEKYVGGKADASLWLGLYYSSNSGSWRWLDESVAYQANYKNWAPGETIFISPRQYFLTYFTKKVNIHVAFVGEPNNVGPGIINPEHCVEMHLGGTWNNLPCANTMERGYICEKLKGPTNNGKFCFHFQDKDGSRFF